jgi:hypothetical protein
MLDIPNRKLIRIKYIYEIRNKNGLNYTNIERQNTNLKSLTDLIRSLNRPFPYSRMYCKAVSNPPSFFFLSSSNCFPNKLDKNEWQLKTEGRKEKKKNLEKKRLENNRLEKKRKKKEKKKERKEKRKKRKD